MSRYYLDLTNFSRAYGNKARRPKPSKIDLYKELHEDRVNSTKELMDRMKSHKIKDFQMPPPPSHSSEDRSESVLKDLRKRHRRSKGIQ